MKIENERIHAEKMAKIHGYNTISHTPQMMSQPMYNEHGELVQLNSHSDGDHSHSPPKFQARILQP